MQEEPQELLPSLEAQVGPADDENDGQEGWRHRRQQQARRQDDEELVAQGPDGDLPDNGQLAVRGDAGDVLRCLTDRRASCRERV